MAFRVWRFWIPELFLTPHFLKTVVDVMSLRPPHVIRLCLGVVENVLHVSIFLFNISLIIAVNFNRVNKITGQLR